MPARSRSPGISSRSTCGDPVDLDDPPHPHQAAGLVTPEPRKRPKVSYVRFEAAQPNQTWQSDFTHWHLADGTDVEILNWLDDHSRYLLAGTECTPSPGDNVVTDFLHSRRRIPLSPPSTLTDNGGVDTARFGDGRNAFEYVLRLLRVNQKNGLPRPPPDPGQDRAATKP